VWAITARHQDVLVRLFVSAMESENESLALRLVGSGDLDVAAGAPLPRHTAGAHESNLPLAPPLQHTVTARRVAVVRDMVTGGTNVERRVNSDCAEVTAAGHAIVANDVDTLGVLRDVGASLAVLGEMTRLEPSKVKVATAVLSVALSAVQYAVVGEEFALRALASGWDRRDGDEHGVWGIGCIDAGRGFILERSLPGESPPRLLI
jgi:hypothetical protein